MKKNKTQKIDRKAVNETLWSVCSALRGNISPGVFMKYVFAMLFYKYVSDAGPDRATPSEGASFYDIFEKRHEPGNGERIDAALRGIEKENSAALEGVFANIRFDSKELGAGKAKRDELLRLMMEGFARPEFDFRSDAGDRSERAGDTFEYLLKKFSMEGAGATAEFYTPPETAQLVARLTDPEPGDEIVDPACGSASFLMECAARAREKSGGERACALFGQECDDSILSLAKMNLIVHGEENYRIEYGDTLRNPLLLNEDGSLRHFDVVVSNPPFSLGNWGYENAENDEFKRFERGIPPRSKGDYAFILHMIEAMKPGTGRMAAVTTRGVLFRGGLEEGIRANIIEDNLLDAVIGLPGKLFFASSIPPVILVFRGNKRDDSVLFIDASRDFQPGKSQNSLRPIDIDAIVNAYTARKNIEKYARLATLEEIREYGYNLNISRYVDSFDAEETNDMPALIREKAELADELAKLDLQLKSYLTEFGISIE